MKIYSLTYLIKHMAKNNNTDTVGGRVKRLRQKRGWTQAQVAAQLDLSIPSFSQIENGITDVNISRLEQIAALFDVPVHEIFIKGGKDMLLDGHDEVDRLEAQIKARENEISALRAKIIDLYEELECLRGKK